MLAIALVFWLLAMFLWGAVCSKMNKLETYLQRRKEETRKSGRRIPGLWQPEYILLGLVMPCGFCMSVAISATLRLGAYI